MNTTLAAARARHEQFARELGISDEDCELMWLLAVELHGIQHPPGPTPEQEQALIKLGRLVSRYLR